MAAQASGAGRASRFGRFPAFRPLPEPADVAAAAAVLRRAGRPFILAGGGVLHSGAEGDLVVLAERLSAAVGTTLSGKGCIAEDHPLSVGVTGSMGTAAAAAALAEADVVLLAGTKAGGGATFGWTLPRRDQEVVQLDLDPAELGRAFPLAAPVLADARQGLRALAAALAGRPDGPPGPPGPPDRAPWRARLAGLTAAWRADRDRERASDAVPIAPQRVLAEIEAALGPDDILICDASLASGWGGVYLEQRSSGRRVLSPRGQAGLGYAVPAAIGVAAARPAARVVVLSGDGALGYAAGEMATLTEQALPVTVVVLNNRSWGWIRWYRRITFGRALGRGGLRRRRLRRRRARLRAGGAAGHRTRPARRRAAGRAGGTRPGAGGRGDRGLADADHRSPPGRRRRHGPHRRAGIWRLRTDAPPP